MSDSEISTIDDVVETKTKAKKVEKVDGDKRRTLTIHATEGDTGSSDVFIAVNGYAYSIKRGKAVLVPQEVIDALANASVTRYRSKQDGTVEMFETPRYTFTVS
jgi:hypothetical protein